MKSISIAALSLLIAEQVAGGDASGWKQRAVYQIITDRFAKGDGSTGTCDLSKQPIYCGGNFDGITNNLNYIKDLGFDAIWISPVVDNTDNGFHGYWARDWSKINDKFGSPDQLKKLVAAAHAIDIWVMVDVVANHVGPVGDDFSSIAPFNASSHYHDKCQIQDWGNQWQVENCRLADLPDLKQEDPFVREALKQWVKDLVQTYGFDGIRIDTIPEVPKDFWCEYGQAAGVFQMGEVFNGDPAYVGPYQDCVSGLFNYPMYYSIRDVFQSGRSMSNLRQRWFEEEQKFKDIDALGIFVDNHDNARFLSANPD